MDTQRYPLVSYRSDQTNILKLYSGLDLLCIVCSTSGAFSLNCLGSSSHMLDLWSKSHSNRGLIRRWVLIILSVSLIHKCPGWRRSLRSQKTNKQKQEILQPVIPAANIKICLLIKPQSSWGMKSKWKDVSEWFLTHLKWIFSRTGKRTNKLMNKCKWI